jgi:hypothetical protein
MKNYTFTKLKRLNFFLQSYAQPSQSAEYQRTTRWDHTPDRRRQQSAAPARGTHFGAGFNGDFNYSQGGGGGNFNQSRGGGFNQSRGGGFNQSYGGGNFGMSRGGGGGRGGGGRGYRGGGDRGYRGGGDRGYRGGGDRGYRGGGGDRNRRGSSASSSNH